MSVSYSVQNLFDGVQRVLDRHPAFHALIERFFPEREHDHEPVVDNAGIFDRKDVLVIQLRSCAGLFAEVLQNFLSHQRCMRNLQSNSDALDRIHRLINPCEAAFTETLFDTVFSNALPHSKCCIELH